MPALGTPVPRVTPNSSLSRFSFKNPLMFNPLSPAYRTLGISHLFHSCVHLLVGLVQGYSNRWVPVSVVYERFSGSCDADRGLRTTQKYSNVKSGYI